MALDAQFGMGYMEGERRQKNLARFSPRGMGKALSPVALDFSSLALAKG